MYKAKSVWMHLCMKMLHSYNDDLKVFELLEFKLYAINKNKIRLESESTKIKK